MSINEIIVYLMVVFMALGAVDRILGNRFGLGEKFEEGIMAMGSLALAMIGIICLAPVLANLLRPVVVPLYQALGADPAMFAGTLLANDMGGAPLAQELALTQEAGQFGGLIVGSMLGPTIVFTIPVGLGIIKAEDRPYLATGVLAGVITIPIGSFAGGLAAGFPVGMVLRNLIPIALFAVLIALGLAFLPNGMVKGFQVFGRIIVIIITIGLAAAIIQKLTPPHPHSGDEPHLRGRGHRGRHRRGAGGGVSAGVCHHQGIQDPSDEAGPCAGHERHRGRRAGGHLGQQHPHVPDAPRYGPAG